MKLAYNFKTRMLAVLELKKKKKSLFLMSCIFIASLKIGSIYKVVTIYSSNVNFKIVKANLVIFISGYFLLETFGQLLQDKKTHFFPNHTYSKLNC